MLHRDHREFAGDRADRPAFLDDDEMVRLLEAGEHRRGVERADRAEIDDLGVDPLARQLVGGFEREPDADRITDDRDVAALTHDPCLADRQHERSEEHTAELQSLMSISYAGFCMKKKNKTHTK